MGVHNQRIEYGKMLVELGTENPDIVVLEADLGKSTMSCMFEEAFPERYFEMGIAEQNMTSFAGGLALAGKIPFTNTFAVFASGRAYDQIRQSIATANLNVKIVGSSSGMSDFGDGATHQSIDDAAIMSAIPNMTVFTPVYCCTDKVPVCYTRVDGADYITFSWNSAFWIFNWVANMVYPRYDLMMGDVRATQTELETTFNEAQEGVEAAAAKLLEKDPAKAKAFLTNYTNMTAQSTFDTWKRLGEFLVVKYNDGVVKRMKNGQFERNSIGQPAGVIRPGYPKEFLEEYVKQTGDRYKMPE